MDSTPEPSTGKTRPQASRYEFRDAENQVLGDLSRRISSMGVFSLLLGATAGVLSGLQVARGTIGWAILISAFAFYFLLSGFWTVRAGRAFRSIVVSTGRDIRHLMEALEQLNRLYRLKLLLLIVCLAALFAMLVAPTAAR
ncbi:MAG TPA: hypothetical protein VMT85_24940 [Thermoanaerobaculia bacterium]|nr:hypothetical protein [Thermoanaerobaculia bacterium]